MGSEIKNFKVLCGIIGPIVTFTCIAVAIYLSPWFSWTENWLSDLGGSPGERPIWSANGAPSIIFNLGPISGGIFGILFIDVLRMSRLRKSEIGRVALHLLMIDMAFLVLIGVFPETTGRAHLVVSTTFFLLVPLSLIPIGVALIRESSRRLGGFSALLGFISLSSFPLLDVPRPWGGNAFVEMFPSVSISLFSIVFGILMFRRDPSIYDRDD
ncbi:MAG: DUF998 domain-containing protein [Halobacteriota archaeon]|nr:DUF998 domain-containing protein [Halobacteriota archaeon]